MIRVLVAPGALVAGALVPLDDEELHHLRVRRVAAGDLVVAYDGGGRIGRGHLEGAGKRLEVQVEAVERFLPPPPLILALATGDRDRYLRVAEQCTELGVTQLVPLVTVRSQSVESRLRATALDKARRRAREACKQSGNPWATAVLAFHRLDELATVAAGTRWLLADPTGAPLPADGGGPAAGWVIGPEGGFTPEELEVATTRLGARRTWLAPHILRFETAAVAAVSLTLDRRGPPGRNP